MLRLLQIDSCLGVLSTGRITEGIAKVAAEHGWECYIAHGARYVGSSNMISYQIDTKFEEYLHYAQSLLLDRHGLGSVSATKRLVDKIETEIKPDIIHLHCIHGYYLNYKILFEYLNTKNIPIVWTFHDCWAFTGHCAHFINVGCEKWRNGGCEKCPQLSAYPKSVTDFSKRNYDLKRNLFVSNPNLYIVPVSEWMSSVAGESFLKDKHRHVIRNGINLSIFRPLAEKKRKFSIIGVASSWGKDKGLHDFYMLREMLPFDKYDITLVGLNSEQLGEIPEGISGIGRTDSMDELARLYSESSVLVNPTYADTFPTVNLEALACGTPVITYDTGGSPEAIDECTGIVVTQGDVKGLAAAVKNICDTPLSSEKCRQRAVELFDQNKCYMNYLELYESLIENRSVGGHRRLVPLKWLDGCVGHSLNSNRRMVL